jgi:cellulose synthase/poly-beta-1,6-N-acetylglucosamine synthase-like glycosyltransferase
MIIFNYIFYISCFLVFYNYAGYAIIAFVWNKIVAGNKNLADKSAFFPSVSFVVAAYNEEDCIEKKITDSLHQKYPKEKIEFIFITDGSTDKTAEIVARFPQIILLHNNERKGKSAAINRAVLAAQNDILVFCDANTFLNEDAVANIAQHYIDEKVGGVAGEKKVIELSGNENEVGSGEGFYWKYESFLKKIDSDFYSVVGAAGELFSLRRILYERMPDTIILDDFVISMKVAQKGFRIIYEPDAYAMELPSFSLKDEKKRKIRIAAGGFQAIAMLGSLFLFWKQPKLSFLYISHRVLRWTLSPLCIAIAFISNAVIFFISLNHLFECFFIAQLLFYLMAFSAPLLSPSNKLYKACKFPHYFVFMNLSVFKGFLRFLRGKQPAAWEKSKRQNSVEL